MYLKNTQLARGRCQNANKTNHVDFRISMMQLAPSEYAPLRYTGINAGLLPDVIRVYDNKL